MATATADSHQQPLQIDDALTGQVALVTGGGRGIGRAIALRLAAAGASVAVLARSADQVAESVAMIEAANGRGLGFTADVTDFLALQDAVRQIEETLGPVTLLVNNAAVTGGSGPSWEVDADLWWQCQEINVRGPFLCAKAVLPGMVARNSGRIVNVSSGAGLVPIRYASAYALSKASLIRWSENLALETEPHGIGVFVIHPGDVITAMSQHLMSEEMTTWLPWTPAHFAKHSIPAERAAALVHWLAAGKGDSLSGRYFSVHEDPDRMVAEAETIRQRKLYLLRMQTL